MIIVSQDKDTIMNFDNIEILGIGNPLEDDDGKFKILANTISDSQYTLAKYDTEERAKEVLQEIGKFYEVAKRFECSSNNGMAIFMSETFMYKMPGD